MVFPTTYRALRVEALDGGVSCQLRELEGAQLPDSELLIRVCYSSLNYKDALSAAGHKGVTRKLPHTPGIDAAGVVVSDSSGKFSEGDQVIVIGYDLGMNHPGGLAEYICIPSAWAVKKPDSLSLSDAMVWGTGGFTAAMCLERIQLFNIDPEDGPVVVTGASGGVGSLALALLKSQGYKAVAVTSKSDQQERLLAKGADSVVLLSDFLAQAQKPLAPPVYAGGVDTLGGEPLMAMLKQLKPGGVVSACGMAVDPEFQANVYPFILRGANLCGIDSAEYPIEKRQKLWQKLAGVWCLENPLALVQTLKLAEVPNTLKLMREGKSQGRYLVEISTP